MTSNPQSSEFDPQSPSPSADAQPVTAFETMSRDRAQELYERGRSLFEAGRYREAIEALESSVSLLVAASALGGEVQVWLVTAYQAAGLQDLAVQLCRQLSKHPQLTTRSQARRLLAILEAPILSKRPEWLTEIPDLSDLDQSDSSGGRATATVTPAKRSRPRPPQPEPEPIDPASVVHENSFLGFGLVMVGLLVGAWWFGGR